MVNSSSHLTKAGQADNPCSSEFMKQVFPKLTSPGTSPKGEQGVEKDSASAGLTSALPSGALCLQGALSWDSDLRKPGRGAHWAF